MPLLHTTLRVERRTPVTEWGGEQRLIRRRYLLGILICKRVLDREDVPNWAGIQKACLGSTEWRSKFAHIKEAWPSPTQP